MSNRSYLVPRPPAFDHEHPRPKEEGEVLYCGNCQKWYVSWFPLTEVKTIWGRRPEWWIRIFHRKPYKYSVSQFMGYLKGKSSLMIFDRHANLKYKYGNRQFWCKGYYVDTVGRNKKVIAEYIRNQLAEDKISDQISIKEYFDPFTGEQVNKSK